MDDPATYIYCFAAGFNLAVILFGMAGIAMGED